jgi:predicted transcriptional regulator of viral defense system
MTSDQRAARVAASQHGVITLEQALDCGLSPDQVRERCRRGRWRRIVRGAFAINGAPATWQLDLMAACLGGPPGTVASHLSALALFGLWTPSPLPHVTVEPGRSARLPIARVHRSPLARLDRTFVGGVPSTTPGRALVDAANLLRRAPLTNVLDAALCRGVTSTAAIRASADRAGSPSGRKGLAMLVGLLDAWDGEIRPGSPAEMRLLRLLRQWGLPEPVCQVEVRDVSGGFIGRLDVGWPDRRAGLEYASDRHHQPSRWDRDEPRYEAFERAGWRVSSVGKDDLLGSAAALRRDVERLLAGGVRANR